MSREEKISRLKDILSEINENDNAVCYLTSEDNELIESAIEALEQEPCYNPDEWCHDCSEYNHDKHCCPRYNKVIRNTVEEMKQPKTGHWILVSEGLPEDIKPVIVTWKNTDPKSYYQYIVGKHFIGTAHYKNGKWFWYSSVTEDLLAEYGRCDSEEFDEAIEVIAWMPLPEPFEPQEK